MCRPFRALLLSAASVSGLAPGAIVFHPFGASICHHRADISLRADIYPFSAEYLPLDMAIAPFRGFPLSPDADGAALGKARACSTVAVRTCRYRWMRAEPPWAKARTCSIVAMVVSPGNVVSNAPCAHPSFTASAGSSPDSSP
jgi:hypothetical protein